MRAEFLIKLAIGIVIPLQVTTVGYVVSIERRLTRLETRDEIRGVPRPASMTARSALSAAPSAQK